MIAHSVSSFLDAAISRDPTSQVICSIIVQNRLKPAQLLLSVKAHSMGLVTDDTERRSPIRARLRIIAACILVVLIAMTWRPIRASYDIYRAQKLLRVRQAEQALPILEVAELRDPENGQVQFLLARCHRRLGRMDQAHEHLAKAWTRTYSKRELIREEWLALAQSGQMRDAHPHLSELLVNPGDDGAEICEAFVNGFFLTNRFPEAFELLSVWEGAFPQDSQPYLFRGRYQDGRANTSEAIAAYRQGLQRESGRRDLQLNLARGLVLLHEHDEATQILKRLQRETPNDVNVLEAVGRCLLQQGQAEESRRVLVKLLEVSPKHAMGRLLLARVHLEERDYPEALRFLKELADERRFDIEVRYSFALALQSMGDTRRAAEEFQFVTSAREAIARARQMADIVMAKEPQNADLRYQIGVILLKYESPEAGAGWLRSVLEFDPDHRLAHRALAEYYEQRDFTKLARTHRERLNALGSPDTNRPEPQRE